MNDSFLLFLMDGYSRKGCRDLTCTRRLRQICLLRAPVHISKPQGGTQVKTDYLGWTQETLALPRCLLLAPQELEICAQMSMCQFPVTSSPVYAGLLRLTFSSFRNLGQGRAAVSQ